MRGAGVGASARAKPLQRVGWMVLFCSGEREGVEMVEVGDVGWW